MHVKTIPTKMAQKHDTSIPYLRVHTLLSAETVLTIIMASTHILHTITVYHNSLSSYLDTSKW